METGKKWSLVVHVVADADYKNPKKKHLYEFRRETKGNEFLRERTKVANRRRRKGKGVYWSGKQQMKKKVAVGYCS